MKALNERLSKVEPQVTWPTMEEEQQGGATPGRPATEPTSPVTPPPKEEPKPQLAPEKQHQRSASGPKLPVPDFKENAKSLTKSDDAPSSS